MRIIYRQLKSNEWPQSYVENDEKNSENRKSMYRHRGFCKNECFGKKPNEKRLKEVGGADGGPCCAIAICHNLTTTVVQLYFILVEVTLYESRENKSATKIN